MSDATITALATFGAAVLGAVVGGLISYFLQSQALAAAKVQHDGDRKEVRKTIGYSLLFKMIRLASDLVLLKKHLEDSIGKMANGDTAYWRSVLPLAPLPDPIQFLPDEMALVLSLDSGVFNTLAAIDERHNSTVGIFALYASKREAATSPFGAEMSGATGTTTLTAKQLEWLAPRAYEMNNIVELMCDRLDEEVEAAKSALKTLHTVLEKEFDLKHKLEFK
jgi:hypothetical protein